MELKAYEVNDEQHIPVRSGEYFRNVMGSLVMAGKTGTIWDRGRIVSVIGVLSPWEGVAEVWQLIHPDVRGWPLLRLTSHWLDVWAESEKVRRFNASAVEDIQIRWLELLGFEREFVMREASPEGDDVVGLVKWYNRLRN